MRKHLIAVLGTLAVMLAFTSAAPAYGVVVAHRYWSDGSGYEQRSFSSETGVLEWIAQKAKGTVDTNGDWTIDWVVLRDHRTNHRVTGNWRGPGFPYYNQWDPAQRSCDIQYTLRYMGQDWITADNYYGPQTVTAVQIVQINNGLDGDGITGATTYQIVASQSE